MNIRVKPDTTGCVWMGEFDLNAPRVDRETFEFEKKMLRIQKYPDACGRGLRHTLTKCICPLLSPFSS